MRRAPSFAWYASGKEKAENEFLTFLFTTVAIQSVADLIHRNFFQRISMLHAF